MKLVKILSTAAAVALVAGALAVRAADDKPEGKADAPRGGRGPGGPGALMDHLLPPRVVDDLSLTAEQKTKYTDLEAAFKKEADKWKSAHPDFADQMRKARENEDRDTMRKLAEERKPLMEARKASVDKLRESLTTEQKATLDKAMDQARNRRGPGPAGPGAPDKGGPGQGGPKGDHPPPPPAD